MDCDRVVFDAHRARILALPDAIAVASHARREELCRIVVKRVVVSDRQVAEIEWTPQALPFLRDSGRAPEGLLGADATKGRARLVLRSWLMAVCTNRERSRYDQRVRPKQAGSARRLSPATP